MVLSVMCRTWKAVYLVSYMECGVSKVVRGTWYVMCHVLCRVWDVVRIVL